MRPYFAYCTFLLLMSLIQKKLSTIHKMHNHFRFSRISLFSQYVNERF